jgi:hypothetical protein
MKLKEILENIKFGFEPNSQIAKAKKLVAMVKSNLASGNVTPKDKKDLAEALILIGKLPQEKIKALVIEVRDLDRQVKKVLKGR